VVLPQSAQAEAKTITFVHHVTNYNKALRWLP
jgi:hypothetical protein